MASRQDIESAPQAQSPALEQKLSKGDMEAAHHSGDNSMVDTSNEAALIDFKTLSWW